MLQAGIANDQTLIIAERGFCAFLFNKTRKKWKTRETNNVTSCICHRNKNAYMRVWCLSQKFTCQLFSFVKSEAAIHACTTCTHAARSLWMSFCNKLQKKKSTKLLHFENKITAQIQTTHCLIFLPININVQKQMFLFSLCIWALLLVCGCARIGSSSITQQLCK